MATDALLFNVDALAFGEWHTADTEVLAASRAVGVFGVARYQAAIAPVEASAVIAMARIPAVDAVFRWYDPEEDVVCICTVVEQHDDPVYDAVLAAEDEIREENPAVRFMFRIVAHQGRSPHAAVPPTAEPLFVRGT